MADYPLPVPVPPVEYRQLTYEALPYDTHPIDIAHGSQGWGPFWGPYTPEDFVSPFWGIDITWYTGDNRTDYGPGYQDLTVFQDASLDSVRNTSLLATLERAVSGVTSYTNTIANGAPADGTPAANTPTRTSRLLRALGVM